MLSFQGVASCIASCSFVWIDYHLESSPSEQMWQRFDQKGCRIVECSTCQPWDGLSAKGLQYLHPLELSVLVAWDTCKELIGTSHWHQFAQARGFGAVFKMSESLKFSKNPAVCQHGPPSVPDDRMTIFHRPGVFCPDNWPKCFSRISLRQVLFGDGCWQACATLRDGGPGLWVENLGLGWRSWLDLDTAFWNLCLIGDRWRKMI